MKMDKDKLIHEIYLFDKALSDFGIQREIKLHKDYFINKGRLHRKIGQEIISNSELITKEKELLAFYETFFSDLDSLDVYRDGSSYFEKVLNFINTHENYDKFELLRSRNSNVVEFNSIESYFKESYNQKFLPQNKIYIELSNKDDLLEMLSDMAANLVMILFAPLIILIIALILLYSTKNENSCMNLITIVLFCIELFLFITGCFLLKKHSENRDKLNQMKYGISDFKDINKKDYYKDIYQFYKDDLFYKELEKQYNINESSLGNHIVGD